VSAKEALYRALRATAAFRTPLGEQAQTATARKCFLVIIRISFLITPTLTRSAGVCLGGVESGCSLEEFWPDSDPL
jgi:hypothetical protein